MRCRKGWCRRGVTLLEIVLAMGLLALLSTMTFWFYDSSLRTREEGTQRAYELRLARVVLDRIATELKQASLITAEDRVGIRGEPERLWLSTLRVPSRELSRDYSYREKPPPGEYDLVKVEYKIARHPEILHEDGYERALGLARVAHLIPRPDSAETGEAFEDERDTFVEPSQAEKEKDEEDGEQPLDDSFLDDRFFEELYDDERDADAGLGPEIQWEELYAPEIRFLRLCYFDGSKWWDDWTVVGENPLPQLVLVTIGFEEHAPFGEDFGLDTEEADEFCTCLNEDPVDCVPLPDDQFTAVVRVPQADPFFRSRVTRETQAIVQELAGAAP